MELIPHIEFLLPVRKQSYANRAIDLYTFLNLKCNWDVCLKAYVKATVQTLEKQVISHIALPGQFSNRRVNQSFLVILRYNLMISLLGLASQVSVILTH